MIRNKEFKPSDLDKIILSKKLEPFSEDFNKIRQMLFKLNDDIKQSKYNLSYWEIKNIANLLKFYGKQLYELLPAKADSFLIH